MAGLRTVGHGAVAADELAALLTGAGVAVVADIRRFPASRRHPWFDREAMAAWLAGAGIGYRWEPRLGGRRRVPPDSPDVALRNDAFRGYAAHMRTPEFGLALDEVLALEGAVVLCAESLWWRCHRRLVADAAVLLRGAEVAHLGHDGRLTPHRPTEGARVEGGVLVYDLGATPPLPLDKAKDVSHPERQES
jgi:uncharacterized protein (DUF488 family)